MGAFTKPKLCQEGLSRVFAAEPFLGRSLKKKTTLVSLQLYTFGPGFKKDAFFRHFRESSRNG